jgi:hypothetical protein
LLNLKGRLGEEVVFFWEVSGIEVTLASTPVLAAKEGQGRAAAAELGDVMVCLANGSRMTLKVGEEEKQRYVRGQLLM